MAGRRSKKGVTLKPERTNHRDAAYDAGSRLALAMEADAYFAQQERRKTVRRSVHIVSDTERIVTEETIYEDTFTTNDGDFWK